MILRDIDIRSGGGPPLKVYDGSQHTDALPNGTPVTLLATDFGFEIALPAAIPPGVPKSFYGGNSLALINGRDAVAVRAILRPASRL